ncbi:MAG: ATP-grasp domain-containing protein [bacterium]|jgi:carbamoyl-phosphate synthase large subunit|nr:ATP-grasp domain-containing protein [bacterium]
MRPQPIADWRRAGIAVSGLNAADNPAPGIAVARSLREAGHRGRLVGLAYDPMDAGVYSGSLFDEVYLVPFPRRGSDALMGQLRQVRADGPLDLVLPTLDSEMELYLTLQPELEELGVRCLLPDEQGLAMRAKSRLAEFCRQHGFAVPPTEVVHSLEGLREVWEDLCDPGGREPVYIKGVFYEARKAWVLEQAEAAFIEIAARWGLPVIAQRGLPGFEYNICCLGDGAGGLIGAVPMRKLGVTDKGKAWSGVTVGEPRLLDLARRMIGALRWRGPCELEILCAEENDELALIEINPRFPAWCYLCAGAGQNLPAALARLALEGRCEPLAPARSGVIYSRAAVDVICDLDVLERLSISGRAVHRPAGEPTDER